MENWHGYSLKQLQGWTTAQESYCRALEQGPLTAGAHARFIWGIVLLAGYWIEAVS